MSSDSLISAQEAVTTPLRTNEPVVGDLGTAFVAATGLDALSTDSRSCLTRAARHHAGLHPLITTASCRTLADNGRGPCSVN